ncbi:hypothetical protein D9758_002839 [Tetrapyrgos nigripes]|uniref:Cytochrome P450 n=1 Tax=Tetrapyrgos nigripes TaxID=182062 RepID=A0A8H5LTM7_9AGAR|nr:hypothetical protein D9758_002839 [Tetrapyrgos nigripes]
MTPGSKVASVAFLVTLYYLFSRRSRSRLPPGPLGLPIFGSVFQFDSVQPWLSFAKWKQLYGSLVYVNFAGQPVIILNSKKAVEDLLVRRASKYSDRGQFLVASEYLTRHLHLVLLQRNERWRKMRRAGESALGVRSSSHYHGMQTNETVLLAYDILNKPDNWTYHVQRSAASAILSLVYAIPSIQSPEDPTFAFMDDFLTRSTAALLHVIDAFPILDKLPGFIARWRHNAGKDFQRFTGVFEEMYLRIKNKFVDGMEQRSSFCAILAETQDRHAMSDRESAWLAGVLYAAGQETTASTIHWFLFSMLLYPEIQQRAQEELDKVVGRSRLPSFNDLTHLPYIQAILRETLRLRPPLPVGVPHAVSEDDYYDGYLIPKGAIVFANVRSLNRDTEIYGSNAEEFRPERHLAEDGNLIDPKDDGHFTYGFGARICVGRHVANNFLFIALANILWAMRIESLKDSAGNPILPDPNVEVTTDGVLIRPAPFSFKATARFEDADTLVQQARDEIMRELAALPKEG